MKYALFALCLTAALLIVVSASSDAGHFVPKAFFTLDSEGHQSNVHPVNPHLLRRLRRQVFSSSSSSSSSASDGGPAFFSSHQRVQNSNGGYGGGGVDINSRFGEDSSSYNNYNTPSGQVVHTSGVFDANGKGTVSTTHGVIDRDGNVKYDTPKTNGLGAQAAGFNINSRFGESSPTSGSGSSYGAPIGHVVSSSSHIDSSGKGGVSTTHGVIDQTGHVNYNTQKNNYSANY